MRASAEDHQPTSLLDDDDDGDVAVDDVGGVTLDSVVVGPVALGAVVVGPRVGRRRRVAGVRVLLLLRVDCGMEIRTLACAFEVFSVVFFFLRSWQILILSMYYFTD